MGRDHDDDQVKKRGAGRPPGQKNIEREEIVEIVVGCAICRSQRIIQESLARQPIPGTFQINGMIAQEVRHYRSRCQDCGRRFILRRYVRYQ